MKLFKKALLATAVFGAMGAQAATISSTPLKLSAEGVAFKVAPTAGKLVFDVVVDKDHPSSSTITLNFDSKVDLTSKLKGGAVTQGVSAGTAFAGDVGFNYGTGSFTFDDVVITDGEATKGETDSITFKVNLGNPLTADSAFRIVLGQHDFDDTVTGTNRVLVKGESTVAYVSNKADKTQIETGTGIIATEVSQFGFEVTQKLDGVINRVNGGEWVYTGSTTLLTDELKYTAVNDESLGLALKGGKLSAKFSGNFKGIEEFDSVEQAAVTVPAGVVAPIPAAPSATDPITAVTVTYANAGGVKADIDDVIVFDNTAGEAIPVTGTVKGSLIYSGATNSGTGVTFPATGYVAYNGVDAGKWVIDATIINVPYLPVNAPNTDTFIHFANETDKEVDVIVTAIDNNGVEYGPMNLGAKLAANTVTKISEPAMDKLFGLNGASTKLSVTFNIDADKGDVTAYAVSQNDKGRTEVSTSQQRGN